MKNSLVTNGSLYVKAWAIILPNFPTIRFYFSCFLLKPSTQFMGYYKEHNKP